MPNFEKKQAQRRYEDRWNSAPLLVMTHSALRTFPSTLCDSGEFECVF